MLKFIRIFIGIVFFCGLTFLFMDFRNTGPEWYDWFRSSQLIPALFAGSVVSIVVLLAITLIFGRIYCSSICPLGILQDFMDRFYGLFLNKGKRLRRFEFSHGYPIIRYTFFIAFIIAMLIGTMHIGVRAWASLVEPYSIFGRIAQSMFSPIYDLCNNFLADRAAISESTQFWHIEAQQYEGIVFVISAITFVVLFISVILGGRIWCNTVCPAGTLLSFLSRYSVLAPVIDTSKCIKCHRCERDCKSECIDIGAGRIDYSRCVTCFNCIGACKFDSLKYTLHYKPKSNRESE